MSNSMKTHSAGRTWKIIGGVAMMVGVVVAVAGNGLGGALLLIGFALFVVGRFMD